MELTEYIEVLLRWGWVIVLVTVLCTTAALGMVKLQTPRYTSMAELTVTPARLELGLSQTVANLLRNYASNVQSESMARRAVERLGLRQPSAAVLRRQIKAEATEAEFRLTIQVTDEDPVFAQRVAQAVAQLLVEDVQTFAQQQDPLDRLTATMLNGGAQPAGQTWPRKKLLAFAGVGGGLVLGLLIALALEWARVEAVRAPQEVEDWVGLPVLGSIPAAGEVRGARLPKFARLRKS